MEIVEPYPYSESDSIQLFSSLPVIGYPLRERREDREKLENENKIYSYLMLYPLLLPLQAEEIPEGKTLWM